MKKLLIALLIATGMSSMGCHHLVGALHDRHVSHRRAIGAAIVGAAVVGAVAHHSAHRVERRSVVVRRPRYTRPVVYGNDGYCDY